VARHGAAAWRCNVGANSAAKPTAKLTPGSKVVTFSIKDWFASIPQGILLVDPKRRDILLVIQLLRYRMQ